MIVLALDISTTSTGIAVLKDDVLQHVEVVAPGSRNVYTRIEKSKY